MKIQQLLEEYKEYIEEISEHTNNSKMFAQSIKCEVSREHSEHKGWRKGKIKFVVQFEPDVVEDNKSSNALDDIRQQIDK